MTLMRVLVAFFWMIHGVSAGSTPTQGNTYKHEDGGNKHAYSSSSFFFLNPMRIPIIQKGKWVGTLLCCIECKPRRNSSFSYVRRVLPQVEDGVFRELYGILGDRFIVKKELQEEVWKTIIHSVINQYIPLQEVILRDLRVVT